VVGVPGAACGVGWGRISPSFPVWLSGFSCCSLFLAGVVGLTVVVGSRLFGAPFCCFFWCFGSFWDSFGCAFGSVFVAGGIPFGGVLWGTAWCLLFCILF